jgi:hypothetical protein
MTHVDAKYFVDKVQLRLRRFYRGAAHTVYWKYVYAVGLDMRWHHQYIYPPFR